MNKLYFLEGQKPLVKHFKNDANNANKLIKTSYLNEYLFTSHEVLCTSLGAFFAAINAHANKGHCLIKGDINHALNKEPRAGNTESNAPTWYICLDFDGAPFDSVEEYFATEPAFNDVSYVVQASASAGLKGSTGLRCHVFMILSNPYTAPYLKMWLKHLNLNNAAIRPKITLTKTETSLSWPLDITTCQSDKLLYIAPPILDKGVVCALKPAERIQLVKKKLDTLPIERIYCPSSEALRKDEREAVNTLRKAALLPALRTQPKAVGEHDVLTGVGIMRMERWVDGDWVRFNINGGDSAAYYHPINDFELIHSFKGEPSYMTKEIFPDYYKDCVRAKKKAAAAPTEKGDLILGICDLATGAYHKVHWQDELQALNVYPAKSEKQLADFMVSHGSFMEEVVPQWDVVFEPHNETIIDLKDKVLNTYVPSPYYRIERTPAKDMKLCPNLDLIMRHAIDDGNAGPVYEHWLNWLAVVVQKRIKTTTAWVISGVSSTGKGLIAQIVQEMLGEKYVTQKPFAKIMSDSFDDWLPKSLFAVLEECQLASMKQAKEIQGTLKHWISEKTVPVRAMHVSSRDVPNYTNFMLTSNYRDPIILDPSDDRYNFGTYQTVALPTAHPHFTKEFIAKVLREETPHLFEYLMSRKASVNQASWVIENETRAVAMKNSGNSLDEIAEALNAGDIDFFVGELPDMKLLMELNGINSAQGIAYHDLITREAQALITQGKAHGKKDRAVESKLSRDQINVIFAHLTGNAPTGSTKFSRMLGHHNIHIKPVWLDGKAHRGIELTWKATTEWCDLHKEVEKPLRRVK